MKHFIFLASLLGTLLFAPAGNATTDTLDTMATGETGPIALRENIVVSGAYIRLGDLFANAPIDKAETAVAYAPKPGRRASFDARWLYRVARAYGLKWRPLSSDLRTMVTRDSIQIQKDEIIDALMASLNDYDLPSNPHIELSNKHLRIHVPSEIMAEVSVEDVSYNRRTNRFAAMLSVGEKNMNASQRVRVTGQVHQMIEIPTLARRLSKGEVIAQNDITWVKLRADRAQRGVITELQDVVGMTPKRSLRPEQPIRTMDIQRPVIVPKGSVVTIILKKPGMTLTSKGRAMENGADGDTIRINNTKTKRTIDAIVIGSSMVTVLPILDQPAQLASIN
ncbi:Flagellar basal body P-ring biosynthesis protein FlgA [Candidatus Terasakiella magnetica]|uniref:Flagellar basal body P-ring biosynthesis protein FlgA n=1 Tax=Candidatus Terasakiella magnetica TaxID=1867952 RepID=A0A1C3RKU8_9PROT|nr:flagellar basal body P-ring formation chaperone FlgA [Candidatus Terasakiella magnetica]SCA57883.1 Flagellar basal body P-ring biosynthesis protein FlgA [Candidatus Terasakiella magnetica]